MQQVFPSTRYHATLPPARVEDPTADEALGAEWSDTPATFLDAPDVATAVATWQPPPEMREPQPAAAATPAKRKR